MFGLTMCGEVLEYLRMKPLGEGKRVERRQGEKKKNIVPPVIGFVEWNLPTGHSQEYGFVDAIMVGLHKVLVDS